MYLDYSKLEFDQNGRPEVPELELRTLGGNTVGVLPGVVNLKMNIKFSEPSEMSFDIPSVVGDSTNTFYGLVTGHKLIYTKRYGVYMTMNPEIENDGVSEIKHVKAYSLEKTLDGKKFFLEEGTFNFWNPASPDDTVIGRLLEIATDWKVGYVSPSLIGRYRTFDSYDDYLLKFVYDHAPTKFRCVFVFDPYEMTINVYDADEQQPVLPIYLDFDNLVDKLGIEEISDELVTAMRPYGSDGLDIRAVNPIGSNWIYDISYFIVNDDIPDAIAQKWESWQKSILNNRSYYEGLSCLRASATTHILMEQAALTDLKGELEDLTNQQSVTIQAISLETTSAGKAAQQDVLDEINRKIAAKKAEISEKEKYIESIQAEKKGYEDDIAKVVDTLAIDKFFTPDEYTILSRYFIEQDLTEETFVASDLDTAISGNTYSISNGTVNISGSSVTKIDLTDRVKKTMYTMTGGTLTLHGDKKTSADLIRGTLEVSSDGKFVMGLYVGKITVNDKSVSSGTITLAGTLSNMDTDIAPVTEQEITTYEGTYIKFAALSGSMFLTANVSEYQRYSVQMELYDFAADVLSDLATATYEFSVDSGNFIFAQEFEPFRNKLELGRGVYLNIGGDKCITPIIIEFELDFENLDKFSVVFSNRFKRHDAVNTLKDMIESSYSSSRSFDSSKYIYNQTSKYSSAVSDFMSSSLDAAKNAILAAANQSVRIDGAGIHIGGDSKYQLRMIDSMIAMTDNNWQTAKLAIGLFATEESGTYFGVNAEVIGGKLIVGNNLIIENTNDNGVTQFKVDATGAWLNNATFILQSDGANGGKIILDPKYGIVAGNGRLFDTEGTTVTPSFIDGNGDIKLDDDGIPTNANFYLDIRDGSAYFRGTVKAVSGDIGGWELAEDNLHSGSGSTYVSLNSSKNNNAAYALWSGAENPANAPFWVKRNGDIYAKNGTFKGTVSGAVFKDLNGNSMMNSNYEFTAGYLNLNGLNVGNGNFVVDASGNVSVRGNITMAAGSSINWALVSEINASSSSAYQRANSAYSLAGLANTAANEAYDLAADALWEAENNAVTDRDIFNILTSGGTRFGIFSDSTSNRLYINANYIRTGTIDADIITLGSDWGGFRCARGSTGVSVTYGAMMYGSDDSYYFIATNAGVRMQSPRHGLTITNSGLFADEEISTDSDRRLKTSIEYQMDKYEEFFMLLKPAQYKYRLGESGRLHTGFIAQDIESALLQSGLTTNDFAGITITPVIEVNERDGITDNYYRLRYGEFISLNTYMIQKLYRRIEELEAKIKSWN